MSGWAAPPEDRKQSVLFPECLDDVIPADHMVRLFDEILGKLDWSKFESSYHIGLGQPPIHPRILASVILYGFFNRILSSRGLEQALQFRLDFRWLASGFKIDHSTLCKFRRKHRQALQRLGTDVLQIAREIGILDLERLGYDGTRMLSNNRRSGTRTLEQLRQERDELKAKLDQYLTQSEAQDALDEEKFGSDSPQQLPKELRDGKKRLDKLNSVLDQLNQLGEAGRTVPKRVPTTDPDSRVMPNKHGGTAPNFTPLATVDIKSGFIVNGTVINDLNEDGHLIDSIEQVQQQFNLQQAPSVLTDGLNGTGANIAACEARGIDLYSPCPTPDPATNPALRSDPSQPVSEADWDRLPTYRTGKGEAGEKKLEKSAFIYDEEKDCYWCPNGQPLNHTHQTSEKSGSGRRIRDRYMASETACTGCPLRNRCIQGNAKARQINREQYEEHRVRHAKKMATDEAQKIYAQRRHPGERPFAVIKHQFGLRRFLLRGLEQVQIEWSWATLAFNLNRLMSLMRSRAGPQVCTQ